MKKIIIVLFFFTNTAVINAQHSYSIEQGLIYYEVGARNPVPIIHYFHSTATALSFSFYYSKNWFLSQNFEYRLKPGIMFSRIPQGITLHLGNCIRYWISENTIISAENYLEYLPFIENPSVIFTYGISFGSRIKDSLFIVPSFHLPIDRAYGMRTKDRYYQNWHFRLGFEWNY